MGASAAPKHTNYAALADCSASGVAEDLGKLFRECQQAEKRIVTDHGSYFLRLFPLPMSALGMTALADSVLTWLECGAWWWVVQVKCAGFLSRNPP